MHTFNLYSRDIETINLLSSVFVFMIAKLLLVSSLRPAMSRNWYALIAKLKPTAIPEVINDMVS